MSYYSVSVRKLSLLKPSSAIMSPPSIEGYRNILLHLLLSCGSSKPRCPSRWLHVKLVISEFKLAREVAKSPL